MARKCSAWIMMLGGVLAAGCAALVVGAGAGAGAYTYVNGELARTYPVPYALAMEVCTLLIKDLNMPVKAQHSDGAQTTIESERRDGTPTTVKVTIIGLDLTEISVRTGIVGYWNKDLSVQFQEFIAQRLQP